MDHSLCPKVEKTLLLLSKKWNSLIVYSLLQGPQKFSEMESYINGISAKMLTERLKELEEEKIIIKEVYPTTPVKIEYKLTTKGLDLGETYNHISSWAEKWN